jgi:integrase/recombinase XerC
MNISAPLIKDLLNLWLDDLILRDTSLHTQKNYLEDLKGFISFFNNHLGNDFNLFDLKNLKIQDLRSWLAYRTIQNLDPKSSRRAISAVKTFLRFLQRKDYITDHIIFNFKGPRVRKSLPRPITPQESFDMINNIDFLNDDKQEWVTFRNKAIITLLYATGMRINEALSLNQNDIFDDFIKVQGKGKKERVVPIIRQAKEAIDKYLKVVPFNEKALKDNETPLFYGEKGKRLQAGIVQKIIRQYRKYFNMEDTLTPHALRHSCASHLVSDGQNLRLVQELLGHSSLSSTQIYTQIDQKKILKDYHMIHPRAKS